jgi:hypothetical protein
MFGKHHTLKHFSVGIAAAASVAIVAVPSALAAHDTWYRNAVAQASVRPSIPFTTDTLGGNGQVTQVRGYNPQAYVYGGASPAVSKAIQDRGFGVAAAAPSALGGHDTWYRNAVSQASSQPSVSFTTDTLGGNGQGTQVRGYNPQAYVYGGASPAVSNAIQARGFGRTAAPPVVASVSSGTSFQWGDAGIGAGIAAGLLLLLLLAGTRLRMHKRSAITA